MLYRVGMLILAVAVLHGELPAQKLTLEEVYAHVNAHNAQLAAARSLALAVGLRQPSAAVPDDPLLQLGFMNLSLPGLNANMPTAMAPSVQVMQMVPFPGKLSLAGRIAGKSGEAARAQADEVWWELRSQAAMAFYELYSLDAQLEVMRGTLELLNNYQSVAKTMYAAGSGRQSDVLRAQVESAKMQAEILRMRAMRTAADAKLNALLDRPAGAPIDGVQLSGLTATLPARDTLRAWAEAARPMLARARVLVEQAQLQRSLAGRELWPDFTVGIAYGQRPADMGTERMGSVMLGFTLPVFASRRQLRMRSEATAMETMARAEQASMRVQVDARLAELLSALERDAGLIELYRANIIPQAEANVQSAFSAYRVGSVDFMTLIDAQMTVNRYRQDLHALLAAQGSAQAELEMTVGRVLPVTARPTVEDL